MKRRTLLQYSAALGVSACLPGVVVREANAKLVASSSDVEITTLSDGKLQLPLSFMFPDVPEDELRAALGDAVVEGDFVEPALNLTLLRSDDRLVLFDVGSGPNFVPTAGKLDESLDAAGVTPDDITDVLFTHGHPDHLWGILDDFDEVLFPEAKLHFPQAEYDFWMDDDTVNQMPEARQAFAIGAKNRLEAMQDMISLFEPGGEIVPSVEAVDTKGHTPGHTSFVVHGAGEPVMVIGDALTNYRISFEHPKWPSGSDQDPEQGIETRMQLLDRLSTDKMKLIGYHLPNEGVGTVEKSGDSYRFVPV